MDPVLIYTDTRRIAEEKAVLTKAVSLFQNVYNALKALGINPTLNEINSLVSFTFKGGGAPNFVQEFATGKILAAGGPYSIGGIPVNPDLIKSNLAAQVNVTAVTNALKGAMDVFNGPIVTAIDVTLLSIAADVISKVADSDTQITSLYTYYTKSDTTASMATDLLSICTSLNTYAANHPRLLYGSGAGNNGVTSVQIPGIMFRNNAFVLDPDYFRSYERFLLN